MIMFKGRIIDLLEASLSGYELIIVDKRKKIIKIYQNNNNLFNVSIELDNSNHIEKIQTSKINWADKSKIEIIDLVILPKNIEEILKKDIMKITKKQYEKREPGKFKLEFSGIGMICLNSKVYHIWTLDGKSKTSSKGMQERNEIKKEEIVRECDKEDCPMFILTKDCLNSGTWKQFFVDGMDEGKSLTSDGINNWDEVVDNINDPKLKQRAIDTNTLYGDEYPDETHIVYGVLKITSEEMEELCYSLLSDSQVKGEEK